LKYQGVETLKRPSAYRAKPTTKMTACVAAGLLWFGKSEDRDADGNGEDDQKEKAVHAGFVDEAHEWVGTDVKQFRHKFFSFGFLRHFPAA
jgi:hypothetical protein